MNSPYTPNLPYYILSKRYTIDLVLSLIKEFLRKSTRVVFTRTRKRGFPVRRGTNEVQCMIKKEIKLIIINTERMVYFHSKNFSDCE